MGKINILLNTMRKFTPEGQKKIIGVLRKQDLSSVDINHLSVSLRSDVFQKGVASKDIIADSLIEFIKSSCKECSEVSFERLISQINQATNIVQGSTSIKKFAQIFSSRKKGLYNFAQKDLKDEKLAEQIKNFNPTGNIESDAEVFVSFLQKFNLDIGQNKYLNIYLDKNKNKNLRYLQLAYNELQTISDKMLKFAKLTIPPTENPEVRKLEKFLKQKYKLDYIHLENVEQAENVKKCLEIATQKNIPIPNNIIVTPYFFENGISGLNRLSSDLKTTIYITANSVQDIQYELLKTVPDNIKERSILFADNLWQRLKLYSTEKPEHLIMHEIIHSEKPILLCNKKIPKKLKDTVDSISLYAKQSFNVQNDEVRNELLTKQALDGLNQNEQEILNILS